MGHRSKLQHRHQRLRLLLDDKEKASDGSDVPNDGIDEGNAHLATAGSSFASGATGPGTTRRIESIASSISPTPTPQFISLISTPSPSPSSTYLPTTTMSPTVWNTYTNYPTPSTTITTGDLVWSWRFDEPSRSPSPISAYPTAYVSDFGTEARTTPAATDRGSAALILVTIAVVAMALVVVVLAVCLMYEAATRKEIPLLATMRELLMLGPASTPATRRRGATTATGTTTTAAVAATGAPTPEQQQRVDLVRGMTPYQRCEYLANFLRTQKYVVPSEEGTSSSSTGEASATFVVSQSTRNGLADDTSANADIAAPSCAICLEEFVHGEDICLSQNAQCPHQFHLTCAVEWLLSSQECPCCRRDYLTIEQPPKAGVLSTVAPEVDQRET